MRWVTLPLAAVAALMIGGCGAVTHSRTVSGRHRASRPGNRPTTSVTHRLATRPQVVAVSYDGTECAPEWARLRAGRYVFELQDRGSDAIAMTLLSAGSGAAISATTPVQPGERASIRARLLPGQSYAWRCQIASQPPATSAAVRIPGSGSTTHTGAAAAPVTTAMLYQPLTRYSAHEAATLARLRGQLQRLEQLLTRGDTGAAEAAWNAAHLSWLELGQDDAAYGAFGELGNEIDGTADGDVGTTASAGFTGFHRVELDLWRRHDIVAARSATSVLVKRVGSITPKQLAADLPSTTLALDAWVLRCHEILEDALRDTLSGDDDYGSNTALAELGADVNATREMLRVLGPLIQARNQSIVPTAGRELALIDAAIRPEARVAIARLPLRRRQRIDAAVGAALETLAPVSELMQISSANS